MSRPQRPLSPHLQIYKPQWTSVLSILHRAAGVVMSIAALLLTWWLWAASDSPSTYQIALGFFTSWVGQGLLFAWTLSTFYHLCNGIRHLFWDVGVGLELPAAHMSGRIVVVAAFALTLFAWGVKQSWVILGITL